MLRANCYGYDRAGNLHYRTKNELAPTFTAQLAQVHLKSPAARDGMMKGTTAAERPALATAEVTRRPLRSRNSTVACRSLALLWAG